MTKIFFIRHGETKVNARGLMHKTIDKTALSNGGLKQVELLANALKNIDVIYSSNEKRCVQSARILGEKMSIKVNIIDGFQERNWGELSEKSWCEIENIIGKFDFKQRYEYVPPGGESWRGFESRLLKTLELIMKENEGKTIVIVTHGGVIRALMPTFLQKVKQESYKYDPENASITEVEYDDGKWKLIRVNDVRHLNLTR
jgi:broad specificity phosphatase PhoE